MQTQYGRGTVSGTRRYDLDWLRVLAILIIFLFHCTRPFDNAKEFHVKNNELTAAFNLPTTIGILWVIPLFFMLSGAATYYALRSRPPGSFIQARLLRLGVPLVTLGWFVLIPPQIYIERLTSTGPYPPPFTGSFLEFLPGYYAGIFGSSGIIAPYGTHLWFLYWLLAFTLIALPLFIALRGTGGRRLIGALAGLAERPGGILLFALPLGLSELAVTLRLTPDYNEGGWPLQTLLLLLIFGFVVAADERFGQAIERHRGIALVLTVLLPAIVLPLGVPSQHPELGAAGPVLDSLLKAVACWLWLVAILGYGRRYLNGAHPVLAYAGEAVLPFFMLHQTIIVIFAYAMRTWDMSIAAKYLLLGVGSFVAIMLVYALLVRPFNSLRFLFGMPPRPGSQPAPQPAVQR